MPLARPSPRARQIGCNRQCLTPHQIGSGETGVDLNEHGGSALRPPLGPLAIHVGQSGAALP